MSHRAAETPTSAEFVAGGDQTHELYLRALFVTDISRWEEVGEVHGEFFAHTRPATTMVEVKALIDPALLVEIEADALVGGRPGADGEDFQ